MKKKYLLILILSFHTLLLVYLKFTAWPEMTLWPYLIAKGWLPYKDIAIAHTPTLVVVLSLFFRVFGVNILQLKIFTWVLIVSSDVLFYWVVRKIWNIKIALVSTLSFVLWQLFFDGNGLWFDLALVPISIVSFYLLNQRKYFWAGVAWAIMFFTKQTAVWFLIPIGIEVFMKDSKFLNFKNLVLGILTPTI
jgi:hypothetical protein